jgi:hypothetical protein
MLTGDTIEGVIRWYDGASVRVARTNSTEITLFFHALSYYENKED